MGWRSTVQMLLFPSWYVLMIAEQPGTFEIQELLTCS